MTESLPVIFRADRECGQTDITAVFPTVPGSVSDPYSMECYAHIGQHSSCCYEWYRSTRPAKPEEYADLLAELRRIYERGEGAVTLQVCKRITPAMRAELYKAARR
jgi:hypothetical protein